MDTASRDLKSLVSSIKSYIELEKNAGISELYISQPTVNFSIYDKKKMATGQKQEVFSQLKNKVSNCKECQLHRGRRNVVFGSGSPDAKLVFVGEAPGMEEDLQGEPFVGRAGELLTKMIEAMGLKRSEVYIANCVKCRPPENRPPTPIEIATCKPYLIEQLKIISPKIICALGKFAAQTLLLTDKPITSLRGKFWDWENIKIMPTFHPAYLLRNPADKRLVWEDLKKIRDALK